MRRISQWAVRSAYAIVLALTMAATTGCASTGAGSDPKQDKEWDRPPGYVPFSA